MNKAFNFKRTCVCPLMIGRAVLTLLILMGFSAIASTSLADDIQNLRCGRQIELAPGNSESVDISKDCYQPLSLVFPHSGVFEVLVFEIDSTHPIPSPRSIGSSESKPGYTDRWRHSGKGFFRSYRARIEEPGEVSIGILFDRPFSTEGKYSAELSLAEVLPGSVQKDIEDPIDEIEIEVVSLVIPKPNSDNSEPNDCFSQAGVKKQSSPLSDKTRDTTSFEFQLVSKTTVALYSEHSPNTVTRLYAANGALLGLHEKSAYPDVAPWVEELPPGAYFVESSRFLGSLDPQPSGVTGEAASTESSNPQGRASRR